MAYQDTEIDVVFENDLIGLVIGPETVYFPKSFLQDLAEGHRKDFRSLLQNIAISLALDGTVLTSEADIRQAVRAKTYQW